MYKKILTNISLITFGLFIVNTLESFGAQGKTQEDINKEFGKMRAQGNNLTINKPLPDVKPATDKEQKKWEQNFDKELNKTKK